MDRTTGREAYRAARDILLRHRDDYHGAVAAFRWPAIGERFNWALDWFDSMAVGNPRMALRIIDEAGSDGQLSVDDWLRATGGTGRFCLRLRNVHT